MDADRFEALLHSLIQSPSRRGALRLLAGAALGGALGWRGLADTEAGKRHKRCKHCGPCKRCKKGKCKPKSNGQACDDGGTCQSGRCVPPFCAGRNSCQDGNAITTCQASGAALCFCTVTAQTGSPFCALNAAGSGQEDCLVTPCPPGETCVDFTGGGCTDNPMGGTACALPCTNPL